MKAWDENTARFDALPPAQKIIDLAIKKSKDEELAQQEAVRARAQAEAAIAPAVPVAPLAAGAAMPVAGVPMPGTPPNIQAPPPVLAAI